MSLVNNMLRDLDQRRRESDNSPSPVKLMPATEILTDPKNRTPIFIVVAVLVVANVLLFAWLQTRDEEVTQQLNIRTEVAESAPEASEAVTVAPVAETETTAPALEAEPPVSEAVEPEVVESAAPVIVDAQADPQVEEQTEEPAPSEVLVAESSNDEVPTPQAAEPGETELAEVDTTPSPPQEEMLVDVTNTELAESVKDSVQMSPEQRDTQAVQTALSLIANNQNAEAYAHLEQHIINNPNAHSSRETYAKLLMNDGELLAAYNLVEAGLALAPNHAGFKKVMARVLIADGQIERAVDILSSRAPEVATDVEYHEILATAQLASRDYQGALISYTGLVQQDQSQGKWWYGFAASQDSLGNTRAAFQAYNRAIQQPNLSTNLRRRSQERLSILSQ